MGGALGACSQLVEASASRAQSFPVLFVERPRAVGAEGKNGEIFGLYATTGRVVSFMSPVAFGVFIAIGAAVTGEENTQYWGILGIVLILAAGFAVMLPVKEHTEHSVS